MQTIDTDLFYMFVLFSIALVMLLIAFVGFYLRLNERYHALRKQKEEYEREGNNKLIEADKEAKRIVQNATEKATQIIDEIQTLKSGQEKVLSDELKKSVGIYANKYNEVLNDTQSEIRKVISGMPEGLRNSVMDELGRIRGALHQELGKSREVMGKLAQEVYLEMKDEIGAYKNQRMKQIDNSIMDIVEYVSKEVLSKEIALEEHEKLVIKALEEAKRQSLLAEPRQTSIRDK